jgi:hypothetical protein
VRMLTQERQEAVCACRRPMMRWTRLFIKS